MKELTISALLAILVALSSCSSTYFYSMVNSTDDYLEKVDNGDFLFQNDSLWIAHCFKGEDAPIQITVFNKLDIPLYVDWKRSALILNGVAYPYSDGVIPFSSESDTRIYESVFFEGIYNSQTYTAGAMELPRHVSFIPPQSMITHSTLRITPKFDEIDSQKYTKGKIGTKDNGLSSLQRIKYEYDDTPLKFASYISTYTKPEDLRSYRSDFYVTTLIKTKVSPADLPSDMAERGDTFYQRKRPNNTGWEILAGAVIVTGSIAIDVLISDDND